MFDKISVYLTKQINQIDPMTDEEKEKTEYGMHLFLSEIIKILIIFITAFILGHFFEALVVYLIFMISRLHLGGIHAKSHIACLLTSLTLIFIVLLAAHASPVKPYIVILIVSPITLYMAGKYAPADLPEKPVISKKQRKELKFYGILSLVIFYVVSLIVPDLWANIIIFTCFIQSLLMTPIIYKITNNQYGYERGCKGYE
jgi:accessory gene regulator B